MLLFGLNMVLTFTGSLSVASAGRDDVRTMLTGALRCNFAWGVIDGVLYLMGCFAEKARGIFALHAPRKTSDPAKASQIIADALPAVIASVLQQAELETLPKRLTELPMSHSDVHGKPVEGSRVIHISVACSRAPQPLKRFGRGY